MLDESHRFALNNLRTQIDDLEAEKTQHDADHEAALEAKDTAYRKLNEELAKARDAHKKTLDKKYVDYNELNAATKAHAEALEQKEQQMAQLTENIAQREAKLEEARKRQRREHHEFDEDLEEAAQKCKKALEEQDEEVSCQQPQGARDRKAYLYLRYALIDRENNLYINIGLCRRGLAFSTLDDVPRDIAELTALLFSDLRERHDNFEFIR
ncbi:hypothetical protein BDV95DRAFT_607648 [Massariosphaeria phaeospora]|uniref:Kinetochore protein SPC25 n=1 Tax=Massariosphaeria phaeospora TaxID=100035 RepID=A0A7C8M6U3_9PLEO|nr:hypothetical protein BDV95DRAFT_607648 [Massariosphaeria phaeospora]